MQWPHSGFAPSHFIRLAEVKSQSREPAYFYPALPTSFASFRLKRITTHLDEAELKNFDELKFGDRGAWPSKVLSRSILHFLAPTAPSEHLLLFRKGKFSLGYKVKNNIPLQFEEYTSKSLVSDVEIYWESIYTCGSRLNWIWSWYLDVVSGGCSAVRSYWSRSLSSKCPMARN